MAPVPVPARPQRASAGSPLVIDSSVAAGGPAPPATAGSAAPITMSMQPINRLRASAFANRSMTVPQGYLVQAVLETGFDSTKAGYARAIVSRDVRGFDGKNVLIPRGSRLIGIYPSTVAPGQNRAVITWTRLIRPDGMTITMDSPSVDPVGRGGVPATVNTHFFARLGDALLQTTFQIGSTFATRAVTGPVVILPGNGVAPAPQVTDANTYVPTLTVAPGKSISVFVAHDLDFSGAGAAL
jgi:type IV secretion system protein VirB10